MPCIRYALVVSAILAAGSFYPHHNYNYFVLMKWVVSVTAVWAALIELEKKRAYIVIVFVIVALIHNPILKFHFERVIWLAIDGLTAGWFAFRLMRIESTK